MKRSNAYLLILISVILSLVSLLSYDSKSVAATHSSSLLPEHALKTSSLQINEVMFYPGTGNYEWVEVKNAGNTSVDISGYGLTDEDGNWYQFPDELPPVPAGAFVVVAFDGEGSVNDDLDFTDNLATLHSAPGLVNIFEDDADQVALYATDEKIEVFLPAIVNDVASKVTVSESTSESAQEAASVTATDILDFVAWSSPPGEDATNAAAVGIWFEDLYVGVDGAPGAIGLEMKGTLGRTPGALTNSTSDWYPTPPALVTLGTENRQPGPYFYNPPAETSICGQQTVFGWTNEGAIGYEFELDDNSDFSSPNVDTNVTESFYKLDTALPYGTYYFRVRTVKEDGSYGYYSITNEVTFVDCTQTSILLTESASSTEVLLGIEPLLQHKDTRMLNVDGDPETGVARWDSAHEADADWIVDNGEPKREGDLDDNYCTRASIAMIVRYLGGNLSQDRISYEAFGSAIARGDLGYNQGMWPNEGSTKGTGFNVFNWAMNDNPVLSQTGEPPFTEIKGWIDNGRPLLVVETFHSFYSHSVVIDGYRDGVIDQVHRIDPWTASEGWMPWLIYKELVDEYHVPSAGVTPRSDEDEDGDGVADTLDDSDGDGIVDFDERYRFSDLNQSKPDSDGDGIWDKADLRSYVFDNNGEYRWRDPDIDDDGILKEGDPDNDNGGAIDGCEDGNQNGKYESGLGETDNFTASDDNPGQCTSVLTSPSPADGAANQSIEVDLSWSVDNPSGGSLTYDVYLEANDGTPDVQVSANQTATSYNSGQLNATTQYYWQIVAHDTLGSITTGPIWRFTTGSGTVINTTELVSVASDGRPGNHQSGTPFISTNGRYVTFGSKADNLVVGDTNNTWDVFVHDRQTGETTRVSVSSDGSQANDSSWIGSISADGRYVAFTSYANNLVADDTNGVRDIFVHDCQLGQTSRASIDSDGAEGDAFSHAPSISMDGRYVAFGSEAGNLVAGDTNGVQDIFIHDRQTGETTRVSVSSDGVQANGWSFRTSISADGRHVAFTSTANNLVAGDTNGMQDIFIHDRQTGETTRVSVASDGTQGNNQSSRHLSISADGRYVAFDSLASNLVTDDTNNVIDTFVHDQQTGETTRVSVASNGSEADNESFGTSISADGRYVAFESLASNLVGGDTNGTGDVFVYDRETGEIVRVSVASDGTEGNNSSAEASVSADGRYVAFTSWASNLVSNYDINSAANIFVHDRGSDS